jgi:regulator of CtrA degradation
MARKNNTGTVVILPGIYDETLALLAEAHDYFYRTEIEHQQLNPREHMMLTSELSRIAMRLSCIMAWLVARKAVSFGNITQKEAQERFRLDGREVCMHQHIEAESALPDEVTDLLDRSLELYQRVARLDEVQQQVF